MKFVLVLSILLTISYAQFLIDSGQHRNAFLHERPIIGILAQEMSYFLDTKWPGTYKSYIAASYIKFVEGAGARPVPIWIGKSKEYYEDILSKLNGVLFPGGGVWFNQTKGYAEAGNYIYQIAKDMNDQGIYMPIFGTCLGFELLLYISAGNREYRTTCHSVNQALPLDFTEGFRQSRIFGSAPDEIIEILQDEPATANFHTFCLTKKNVSVFNFDRDWEILSYSRDLKGLNFVSSIENKRYPFYGVQFHPEKSLYEWVAHKNIPHTENAIKMAQYFARFFVHEARKNGNRFSGVDEENRMLIYNFPVTFTALAKSAFEQCYLFTKDVEYGDGTIKPCKSGANGSKNACAVMLILLINYACFTYYA